MNIILPLLSFATFIIYLNLGIYVLAVDRKSYLNRIFFALAATSAVYAFGYTFFLAAPDKETAIFWYKLSAFGMRMYPAFGLHFFLVLTNREWGLKSKLIYLVYLPPLAVVLRTYIGIPFYQNMIHTPYGWANSSYPHSIWYTIYNIYQLAYFFIGTWLVYRWGRRSTKQREKKQAVLLIIFSLATFILSVGANILLPALLKVNVPKVMAITQVFLAIGMWYAIIKYKLLSLTPSLAVEEIISGMKNIFLLLDHEKKIVRVNPYTEDLTGFREYEVIGKTFDSIFSEANIINNEIAFNKNKPIIHLENSANLKTKKKSVIPVDLYISVIRDQAHDLIGYTVLGQDRRPLIGMINDSLTGAYNRSHFYDCFAEEKNRYERTGIPFSVAFIDIDKFKEVNDQYDHMAGDFVLKNFIDFMRKELRNQDIIFRYGGDEFLVIFPDTGAKNVYIALERLRKKLQSFKFYYKELNQGLKITFSSGIASIYNREESVETLLEKADRALYNSKALGRNKNSYFDNEKNLIVPASQ